MFLSAKAFYDSTALDYTKNVYRRADTDLPAEFVKLYKRNVVNITPRKTGALRRSIIPLVTKGRAEIAWRSPYAGAQNKGGHTITSKRVVNMGDGFVTLKPGFYRYSNYTTPGTGPNFATIAFMATRSQMPMVYRQLGLTR